MSETYTVLLLVEQAMTSADAQQVRSLHEELREDGHDVGYHVLLPVEDAAARIEAALGSVTTDALGETRALPDPDLVQSVEEESQRQSADDLASTLAALRSVGADAEGHLVDGDPIEALAAAVTEVDGREAIILTRLPRRLRVLPRRLVVTGPPQDRRPRPPPARARDLRRAGRLRRGHHGRVTAAGIFLTHRDSPRIRGHFDRLVAESGDHVAWKLVFSHDAYPRPEAPFPYADPAAMLPARYRAMEEHGGVQGGYLDTLLIPVLRGLATASGAERLWVCEYDVDFAGRWSELFARVEDDDADLLTTTVMWRHEQPKWPWWRSAGAPAGVPEERWVRSLNPLMRLSVPLLDAYAAAGADAAWQGHYEFTLPTLAREAGLRVADLGGEGSFVPAGRERAIYVGKSPSGRPKDLTFGFRPVRPHYFHEAPDEFEQPGLLYHPVKPDVAAWTRATMNVRDEQT